MSRPDAQPIAQVSRTIDAPPADVWDALTSPEQSSKFMMGADVDSDFRVGSPITFKGVHEGKSYEDRGKILEAEDGRRLRYSHYSPMSGEDRPENYSTVTFDLEPEGESTKVTLSQANFTGGDTPSKPEQREQFEKNWAAVLDGLSKTVAN